MLIGLTDYRNGQLIVCEASVILFCLRQPPEKRGDPWLTKVITGIQTPAGMQSFTVRETPFAVALRINAARYAVEGKTPVSNDQLGVVELEGDPPAGSEPTSRIAVQ